MHKHFGTVVSLTKKFTMRATHYTLLECAYMYIYT